MKFRKRPVVIEAEHLQLVDDADRIARWVLAGGGNAMPKYLGSERRFDGLLIWTREGTMKADLGDYIIRGVQGEFYPCKPDIFAATYDPLEPASAAVEEERWYAKGSWIVLSEKRMMDVGREDVALWLVEAHNRLLPAPAAVEGKKRHKVQTKLPKKGELRDRAILGGDPSL